MPTCILAGGHWRQACCQSSCRAAAAACSAQERISAELCSDGANILAGWMLGKLAAGSS